MDRHNISMHSLGVRYGKDARDDKMIDAYLQRRHEASNKRLPAEYKTAKGDI
jgi:hypothetical protein